MHLAEYGSTVIPRKYCRRCKCHAFVIDGELQCCDMPVDTEVATEIKKMSESDSSRLLGEGAKRKILNSQDGCCAYCGASIGSYVVRNGKPIKLRAEYDHIIPFSFVRDTKEANIVASCHVCNGLKGATIYNSWDEARSDLQIRREAKGYNF